MRISFILHPSSFILLLLGVLGAATYAQQVQNFPHAGYVYPAGGRQGTTVEVRLGGRFLDNAGTVLVEGRGVHAEVVGLDKPAVGQQLNELREKAQALQKRLGEAGVVAPQAGSRLGDPAVKELADLRARIGDSVRRMQNPALSEIATLRVTIDADAEPGLRQLRVGTPVGLSNPVRFDIGQLPEFQEREDKRSKADAELSITLPATVNGRLIPGDINRRQFPLRQAQQYAPGDADRYRFAARKGQDLVVAASARALVPYLADAVPGWLQATLTLVDAAGHEVAYNDDYRFSPDPVLHYVVPADGDYIVEIRDALYRGREDFVYRLSIGELPFITGIFPLGGRAGKNTEVSLIGWNLPASRTTVRASGRNAAIVPVSVSGRNLTSNRVPFAIDAAAEATEREPNGTSRQAQPLTTPVIVNGRIQEADDVDMFAFRGRAGQEVVAEVTARRLESPLDSVLELVDAAGRRLAFNDDYDDKGAALVTHQADSLLTAKLPATGTYYVRVGDRQHKGGSEYAYRLRIDSPHPDFELRITPAEINAIGNAPVPATVYASRKDGFAGDIVLSLVRAPGGSSLAGGLVPAGQQQARVTITMPPSNSREPFSVAVDGTATIAGKSVTRRAVPADDMMQAFAYRHLVTADDLRVVLSGRGATRIPPSISTRQPIGIAPGGRTTVQVTLPPGYRTFENLRLELSEPPVGVTIGDIAVDPAPGPLRVQFSLRADSTAKPGVRGNLIVLLSGERVVQAAARPAIPPVNAAVRPTTQQPANGTAPAAPQAQRRRVTIGTLPAIAFEIR